MFAWLMIEEYRKNSLLKVVHWKEHWHLASATHFFIPNKYYFEMSFQESIGKESWTFPCLSSGIGCENCWLTDVIRVERDTRFVYLYKGREVKSCKKKRVKKKNLS